MLSPGLISAFRGELQKEASIGAALGAGAVAALSGGVALYDARKSREAGKLSKKLDDLLISDETPLVDAKEYMKKRDPTVKVVTDIDEALDFTEKEVMDRSDVAPMTEGLPHNEKKRVRGRLAEQFISDYMLPGRDGGMAYVGRKGNYILAPRKTPAAVLEHELGHIEDFKEKGLTSAPESQDKSLYERKAVMQMLWKPSFKRGRYRREEEAWDRADQDTEGLQEMRDTALGTYEGGFHDRRKRLAKNIAILSALAATAAGGKALADRM